MSESVSIDNSRQSSEAALVRRAKAGDPEAYKMIIEPQRKRMLRLAWRITKNHEDAEDAVQNAVLKVLRHLQSFREKSKFSTWVLRITLNECLSQLRQTRGHTWISLDRDASSEGDLLMPEMPDTRKNPEQLLQNQELQQVLAQAISLLKPTLQSVFVMRDIKQLSIKETAAALKLSDTAVKIRLMRARLFVRDHISPLTRPSEPPPRICASPKTSQLRSRDTRSTVTEKTDKRYVSAARQNKWKYASGTRLRELSQKPPQNVEILCPSNG